MDIQKPSQFLSKKVGQNVAPSVGQNVAPVKQRPTRRGKYRPPRDEYRCKAIIHGNRRCRRAAIRGMTVCGVHGGGTRASKRKAEERLADLGARAIIQIHRIIRQAEYSDNPFQYLKAITAVLDRTGLPSQGAKNSVNVNVDSNTNVHVTGDLFSIDALPLEVKMLLMYARDNAISGRLKAAIKDELQVHDIEGGVKVVNALPGDRGVALPPHDEPRTLDVGAVPVEREGVVDSAPRGEVKSPAGNGEGVAAGDKDMSDVGYSGSRILSSGITVARMPVYPYRYD